MLCTSCGTENPSGARFCMSCAAPLSLVATCGACDAELPDAARFCPACGTPRDGAPPAADPVRDQLRRYIPDVLLEKLESARAGRRMAGERRTVTMLFCDLQGSTAAAGELDPEDWAEIVNEAFEHLIRPVYAFEGTLARLMGDAILAFFGAPIGHEDDPERACLAALQILEGIQPFVARVAERWHVDIDVRIGIHTGLVVVGEMGSDLRLEYTAMGDAVNLAARMEQTAAPGTIQISADTHRLIAPLFDTEDLGTVEVKGKAEPISTFRVLGRRAVAGSLRGIAGLDSPMVGRDAELEQLQRAVDELEGGRGGVVSVMAEAGLGKSRLVTELERSLEAQGRIGPVTADHPAPIRWEEGRCQSYTATTPYAPFIDLFTSCFGLEDLATPEQQRDRVHEVVGDALPGRVDEIAPYLDVLLGLPVPPPLDGLVLGLLPPELRAKVVEAVVELVAGLSQERPLAIVLEDLHWADSTSIDLLSALAPVADQTMLLLVAIFRPRREDPSWSFHETAARELPHRYTSIELRPLPDGDGRQLVANLLRIEGLPEHVRSLILAKAEGNPFFVEEVVRSLIDSGAIERDGDTWRATRQIDDVRVPDTLAALISTRLDRLDDTTKLVTYTAAIIGRQFDRPTLELVLDDVDVPSALAEMERRELVRETARVPVRTYRFTHALTQETAYDSALVRTRRDLHARLAARLEADQPDAAQDLARHWLGADEPVRAVPHLVAAGAQAFEAYAMPEAIRLLREATSHVCEACATPYGRQAWEVLAAALTFSGDIEGANEAAQRLVAFAEERQDLPAKVAGLNKMAFAQMFAGQNDQAFDNLEQACSLATESGDDAGLAEANMTFCYIKTNAGLLESALTSQQEAMRLGIELSSPLARGFGLSHYANTLLYLTRYEEAEVAAEEARSFATETGQKHFQASVTGHTLAFLRMREGRFDQALALCEESVALAAGVGATNEWAVCEYTWGQALMAVGRFDAALRAQQQALDLALGAGLGYLATAATSALAVISHNLGRTEDVERFMAETLERFDMPVGNAMASACYAEIGFCAMMGGDLDLARDRFERGIESQSAASYLMEPMLKAGLGMVHLQQGDTGAARASIDEAAAVAEAKAMQHMIPITTLGRAQVALADGHLGAATDLLAGGEDRARAMGMLPMAQLLAGAQAQAHQAAGDEGAAAEAMARCTDAVTTIASSFTEADLAAAYTAAALQAATG